METGVTSESKHSLGKQYLILFAVAGVYFSSCFARTTMVANQLNFVSEYSVLDHDVGLILAMFSIGSGVGQIVNSIFVKHYNKRFSLAVPAFLLSVLVFSCFFAFDFQIYKFIWLGMGICYSFIWMSLMKILSENLDDEMLGRASICLSVCNGIGTASSIMASSFRRMQMKPYK